MSLQERVKDRLKRYIINPIDHPKIPRSLDGEILLEEVKEDGVVKGWITIPVDEFVELFKDEFAAGPPVLERIKAKSEAWAKIAKKWQDEGVSLD